MSLIPYQPHEGREIVLYVIPQSHSTNNCFAHNYRLT